MEGKENTILRSSHGREQSKNGGGQGRRSAEVANTTIYVRCITNGHLLFVIGTLIL